MNIKLNRGERAALGTVNTAINLGTALKMGIFTAAEVFMAFVYSNINSNPLIRIGLAGFDHPEKQVVLSPETILIDLVVIGLAAFSMSRLSRKQSQIYNDGWLDPHRTYGHSPNDIVD